MMRIKAIVKWMRDLLPISRGYAVREFGKAQAMWHTKRIVPEITDVQQRAYEQMSRNADSLRAEMMADARYGNKQINSLKAGKASAQTVAALARRVEALERQAKGKRKGAA